MILSRGEITPDGIDAEDGLGGSKEELNSLDSALDTEGETTDDEGHRLS